MLIAKVTGNVISTQKQEAYKGLKLLMVQPVDMEGNLYGSEILAVDAVGAGIGDVVTVMQEGGSTRQVLGIETTLPIDVAIAGIVDRIDTTEGSYNQFKKSVDNA